MRRIAFVFLMLALAGACRFDFSRELGPGELRATLGLTGVHGFTPVAGATLTLVGTRLEAVSDVHGLVILRDVPASTYDVRATATLNGHPERLLLRGVVVADDGEGHSRGVDLGPLTLELTGAITGVVLHAGAPAPAAQVALEGAAPVLSDDLGHFSFDSLAPGTYPLALAEGDAAFGTLPAKVVAGEATDVTLDDSALTPLGPGRVTGHALQMNSPDEANIAVTLTPITGGDAILGSSDADGAFELDAPAGVYTFAAHRDGASDVRLDSVVVNGDVILPLIVLGDPAATDDLDDDGHPDARSLELSSPPSPPVAGVPTTMHLVALDAHGDPATGYLGTISLDTDGATSSLATYAFQPADGGATDVSVTFPTAGTWQVTATDSRDATLHSAVVTVQVGATVEVSVVGIGHGTVTGGHVACHDGTGTCEDVVQPDSPLVLTATPDDGYVFSGWRGACAGRGSCTLTTSATSVEAGFAAVTYWDNAGIHACALDGSADELLIENSGEQAPFGFFGISADGLALAYEEAMTDNLEFVDLATNASSRLTNYTQGEQPEFDIPPAIAPDDHTVAFVGNAATDGSDTTSGGWNLFVSTPGGTPRALTTDGRLFYVASFDWSPDGSALAFVSMGVLPGDPDGTSYENVWVVNADGSGLTRLTNFTTATVTGDPTVEGVSWSPDGSRIAFASALAPGPDRSGTADVLTDRKDIWTVEVASGALFCVTNFADQEYAARPQYARSGHDIVFESLGLEAIADDGTNVRTLDPDGNASWWLGDGATLLYESGMDVNDPTMPGAGKNIWRVTLDGSVPATPVTRFTDGRQLFSPYDSDD